LSFGVKDEKANCLAFGPGLEAQTLALGAGMSRPVRASPIWSTKLAGEI